MELGQALGVSPPLMFSLKMEEDSEYAYRCLEWKNRRYLWRLVGVSRDSKANKILLNVKFPLNITHDNSWTGVGGAIPARGERGASGNGEDRNSPSLRLHVIDLHERLKGLWRTPPWVSGANTSFCAS